MISMNADTFPPSNAMKKLPSLRNFFGCVLLLMCVAAVAHASSISGVVRDEHGSPIAGARITLAGSGTFATTSDTNGAYQFPSLAAGTYHLEAAQSGFDTQHSDAIVITGASGQVALELTMHSHPEETAARPQFEAAGIRGLIDPGGYSASAGAAAASGLIKGITGIKRTGNDSAMSPKTSASCALEPALKKALEEKPESGAANLNLGEFYLAHGQTEKATPLLERARSLNKGDQETLRWLAGAYLKEDRFDVAEKLLTTIPATESGPETHRLLAQANEGMGRFTKASQEYQLAANQQPSEENLSAPAMNSSWRVRRKTPNKPSRPG
jgi:hypothetical protein